MATTVHDGRTHEIQFISVKNGTLLKDKQFPLQHDCRGIAHYQELVFVSSGTALYQYSLDWQLVKQLYGDTLLFIKGENLFRLVMLLLFILKMCIIKLFNHIFEILFVKGRNLKLVKSSYIVKIHGISK